MKHSCNRTLIENESPIQSGKLIIIPPGQSEEAIVNPDRIRNWRRRDRTGVSDIYTHR